jgi:toxin ParE1/3/4
VAQRVVTDIACRVEEIRDYPDAGAPRDHVRPGLRAVIKHNYVAYYHVTSTEIVVLRVLHGSRDIDAIRAEGGFDT